MEKIMIKEYIRDREGNITKIQSILNLFKDVKLYLGKDGYQYPSNAIIKHSKNLKDLIEVKDVIKYRIDNISTTLETRGYIEGIVDISDEEMLQKIKSDKNYHILEILTKEHFEANCYKVGGEDE